MAAFVLRPELARKAVRHFLFNEYVDLSFFPLCFKLSVIIILWNKNKPVSVQKKAIVGNVFKGCTLKYNHIDSWKEVRRIYKLLLLLKK